MKKKPKRSGTRVGDGARQALQSQDGARQQQGAPGNREDVPQAPQPHRRHFFYQVLPDIARKPFEVPSVSIEDARYVI